MSDTGAPNPGGGTPFRAIISVIETAAFSVALIASAFHGGHFGNPWTVVPALAGFTAHGINHPAGGSPI